MTSTVDMTGYERPHRYNAKNAMFLAQFAITVSQFGFGQISLAGDTHKLMSYLKDIVKFVRKHRPLYTFSPQSFDREMSWLTSDQDNMFRTIRMQAERAAATDIDEIIRSAEYIKSIDVKIAELRAVQRLVVDVRAAAMSDVEWMFSHLRSESNYDDLPEGLFEKMQRIVNQIEVNM